MVIKTTLLPTAFFGFVFLVSGILSFLHHKSSGGGENEKELFHWNSTDGWLVVNCRMSRYSIY